MNPNIEIVEAGEEYLTEAAKLFDAYRVFYEQNSDIEAVTQFLKARILQKESVLFLARYENEYVGFTQLYPSFTSVGLAPIWILNDLYVAETHRQKGIAQQLIETAANYARKTNRKKLRLSTAYDNTKAQQLYEKLGFIRQNFHEYELIITA